MLLVTFCFSFLILLPLHQSSKQVLKTSAAALCETAALCIGIGFCHCWILWCWNGFRFFFISVVSI